MNSSMLDNEPPFSDTFVRNFVLVLLGITINMINGVFVFTFFRSSIFYNDPRYILYIHLVINDMLMVIISVMLFVLAYAWPKVPLPICVIILTIASATHKNTPLTLAGMAIERYIAVCKPLHHHQICTVRRTYILISLIWGVGVLPGLSEVIIIVIVRPLSVFKTSSACVAQVVYNTPVHNDLNTASNALYLAAVWAILVFTYCQVLIVARRASADKASAKKAQNTILLHGAQLLLCMLSYITALLDKIYFQIIADQQRKMLYFFHYLLTNILPRLLTPLIYGVRDKHFYNHIKGLFSCKLLIAKVESIKQ